MALDRSDLVFAIVRVLIEATHPIDPCVLKQPRHSHVRGFSFDNLTVTSTRVHNRRFL